MIARQIFQFIFPVGRGGQHGIDIRRGHRVHFLPQPRQKLYENASQHRSILTGTVMLKRADRQLLRQNVQLELVQMRQHQAGHFQRIDRGEHPLDPEPLACRAQKAHIEACIVRHKRILSLARPRKELRYCLG